MGILELKLSKYRNFSNKIVVFDKNLTVIIGPNGSGKSNILEAISLLSGVRSQKVETDLDLIGFGKDEAKIEGKVESFGDVKHLTIVLQAFDERRVGKAFFIDNIKKRLSDFMESLAIVVFHPADLDLVSGPPSLRRHHIDQLLSVVSREYWRNLSAYNKIITRRNKILIRILESSAKRNELDFWDERLLSHGKFISKAREDFFEFLNLPSSGQVSSWNVSWELKQSTISEEKLLRNRERDIAAGVTLSGPQRDDFRFLMREKDLEYFGSRGEQRMAVLALKIAELEYFQVKMGARPILALDDIFSELDWEHREAVLEVVGKQQTIITAAEKESVPKELLNSKKLVIL